MRKALVSVAAILLCGLAGCVPSVYPIYTAKDLQFDPALVGEWIDESEPDESWTFKKDGDSSYQLVVREGQERAPFKAHLVRLGQHRFLDIEPDEEGLPRTIPDVYRLSLIRGHLIAKVTQIEPTLKMAFLDPDWLAKRLSGRPAEIAHINRGDKDFVLTAPTRELQKFLLQHAADKEAFGDESNLKKK